MGKNVKNGLYDALKHGSDEHREWIRETINNYFDGKPLRRPVSEISIVNNIYILLLSEDSGYPYMRIGVFKTRESAEEVGKIEEDSLKSMGFNPTFIIEEEGVQT